MSVVQGKSTANQRIESYWGRMRQQCVDYWITLFKAMWDKGVVNDSNPTELELFRYESFVQYSANN